MKTLDDLIAVVSDQTSLIESVSSLLTELKEGIDECVAGSISPDDQAKIDLLFETAEANKSKLVNALAANTPAEGTTEPEEDEGMTS